VRDLDPGWLLSGDAFAPGIPARGHFWKTFSGAHGGNPA